MDMFEQFSFMARGLCCVEIKGMRFVFRVMTQQEYNDIIDWRIITPHSEYDYFVKVCETCLVIPQDGIRKMDDIMDLQDYLEIVPTLARAILTESKILTGEKK